MKIDNLFQEARKCKLCYGGEYPLYHTSKRARITRNTEQQKIDWLRIKEILNKL